jgi:dihydrofolate reductase
MNDAQAFDFRAFHAQHRVAMIVACSENGVIGVDGDLPWRLPTDLRHFMRSTKGCPVVMGRKTFESLHQPLLNRLIVVVSRTMSDDRDDGVRVAGSIEDAIAIGEASDMDGPIWIAGGGHIYKEAMGTPGMVDLIVRTLVHTRIEGDTVFPEIDEALWSRARVESFEADEKHAFSLTIEWWGRR